MATNRQVARWHLSLNLFSILKSHAEQLCSCGNRDFIHCVKQRTKTINEVNPAKMFTCVSSIEFIRGYSFKELCNLYDESPKIMRAWLKPHQEAIGCCIARRYTPKQVRIIIEKIGLPQKIAEIIDQNFTAIQ